MEELRARQGTTSLRLGASLLRSADTRVLLLTLLGLPVIALVVVIYLIGSNVGAAPICPAIWEVIRNTVVEDPAIRVMAGVVAVVTAIGLPFFLMERRARLRITPDGLEADIPRGLGLLGFLRQTAGEWRVPWDDVRRVRLLCAQRASKVAQRLASYRLVIETSQGEIRIAAFRWFDHEGKDHRLRLRELLAMRTLDAARRIESAPLLRAIRARGLAIDTDAGAAAPGFDLAQHKGIMAQVCLLFVAGVYAVGDALFVRAYLPLGSLPLSPFVITGIIAACAVWRLGRGAPPIERVAIGALAVAACVAAAYPGMLRFNAATAESEIVAYVSVGGGRFELRDGRLPALDLSGEGVDEYWAQYPPGARHEFTLLRGRAGFYQLELAPFHERTRQFYAER